MSMTALILASGRAPALGYAKANLCIHNQTILEKVTASVRAHGCEAIILSIGEDNDPLQCSRRDIQPILATQRSCPVSVSVSKPEHTPVESIHQAIRMVKPSGRVLLWPIEYPFADARLIRALEDSFAENEDHIAIPTLGQHRGYPILLGRPALKRLMQTQCQTSLQSFIQGYQDRLKTVATTDPRIIMSVNLPEQAAVLGIKSPGQFHRYS